jgi:archaellum component FlaG (FlaF/FlaG flagellin family)
VPPIGDSLVKAEGFRQHQGPQTLRLAGFRLVWGTRARARALVSGLFSGLFLGLFLGVVAPASVAASDATKEQMQSLDEQVQEIKSDVLSIAAELNRLEEKLLYPSNTQVAVFVSIAEGETLELDSVRVLIDGELVAHHIYSFKELQALQKGGVQRIYTGNVATGDHQIEVSAAGKLSGGADFGGTQSFAFRKDVEPKLVGVTLAGQDFGGANIEIGGW